MELLTVQNIRKSFSGTAVLNGISFALPAHKTLAILGRSGCGKTTLLKIIAGLLDGEGQVILQEQNITRQSPQQRGIVYLYQEALLFPHLNAFENIAFGLRLRKLPHTEIKIRTEGMLVDLGLENHALKMPAALSGGQKQRVAFGRALVIQPQLLLLDEPFGALDVDTRSAMQTLFKRIAATKNITAVFVTHDLKEAVLMGDQLGFMENGNLQIFSSLHEFSNDVRTGMPQEIEFWKTLFQP